MPRRPRRSAQRMRFVSDSCQILLRRAVSLWLGSSASVPVRCGLICSASTGSCAKSRDHSAMNDSMRLSSSFFESGVESVSSCLKKTWSLNCAEVLAELLVSGVFAKSLVSRELAKSVPKLVNLCGINFALSFVSATALISAASFPMLERSSNRLDSLSLTEKLDRKSVV